MRFGSSSVLMSSAAFGESFSAGSAASPLPWISSGVSSSSEAYNVGPSLVSVEYSSGEVCDSLSSGAAHAKDASEEQSNRIKRVEMKSLVAPFFLVVIFSFTRLCLG